MWEVNSFSSSSWLFRVPGLLVIEKKKRPMKVKRTALTQYLGLALGSFVTGLVHAAVTGLTKRPWVMQLVDIVGAAVLYFNEERAVATVFIPVNADFSLDCTLGHSRMISTQPDRKVCITSVLRWTCGHHFCSCGFLEAIPAIECVVTFGVCCCVVIFSCSICQRLVIFTCIG